MESLLIKFIVSVRKEIVTIHASMSIRHVVALTCTSTRYSIVGVSLFFNFKEGFFMYLVVGKYMKISLVLLLASIVLLQISCSSEEEQTVASGVKFGLILVGPKDDKGYSQAHYEGGQWAEEQSKGTMIVIDKINPADSPNITVEQVVDDMVAQGAQLVSATSDDMKDGILAAAAKHPTVPMIWASGDSAWKDGNGYRSDLTNLGNVFGQMEYGKMIAGCAAAIKSKNGKIGFLGPLINDETRRLANSAYLGAKHCLKTYNSQFNGELDFSVTWIGFWFNIPGVTLDPTQVSNEFFDSGADVVISGIDTPDALIVAGQRAKSGETVWAVPYDYEGACEQAPDVCLGVPYFNWGPAYLDLVNSVGSDTYKAEWKWVGPNWGNINHKPTSSIGYKMGDGLTEGQERQIQSFIDALGNKGVELFTGPLNFQDGSQYLADGEKATDKQIWYTPMLLEGMKGDSAASN